MTDATLSAQLKQLEAKGLLTRTQYESIPPRVGYELTPIGRRFRPAMEAPPHPVADGCKAASSQI